MKRVFPIIALLSIASTAWAKQNPQIPLDFPELAKKASETVNVSLPKSLLELAAKFISADDADSAKIKKLLSNVQGIFVRSYEFDKEGEYSPHDLDPIRKIITGAGWNCLVSVHSKKNNEDTDVCLRQDSDRILGLAVVSTETKKFTIVNVLGSISPEDLQLLREFGVPDVTPAKPPKGKDKDKEKEKDKDKDKDKDKEKEQDQEN
jgi:hypothetical protein